MSDAILSFFLWPIDTLYLYIKFLLGCLICLFPLIWNIISTKDKSKSIRKFDNFFKFLSAFPLGKSVFSGIVGFFAPYTANIAAKVEELCLVKSTIIMVDKPWLRNPFKSIHAIALANLGEFSSGVLIVTNLQYTSHLRGIPIKINNDYYKKARGVVTAKSVCNIDFSKITEECEIIAASEIFNDKDEMVAKTMVTWKLIPTKKLK